MSIVSRRSVFKLPALAVPALLSGSIVAEKRVRTKKHKAFHRGLHDYTVDTLSQGIAKMRSGRATYQDLNAAAAALDNYRRHIDSLGLDKHVQDISHHYQDAPALSSVFDLPEETVDRLQAALQKHNPDLDSSYFNSLLANVPSAPDPQILSFVKKHGYQGVLRMYSQAIKAQARIVQAGIAGESYSSVSYEPILTASRHGQESDYDDRSFEYLDGLSATESIAHLEQVICKISKGVCTLFSSLATGGVAAAKDLLKDGVALAKAGAKYVKSGLPADLEAYEALEASATEADLAAEGALYVLMDLTALGPEALVIGGTFALTAGIAYAYFKCTDHA